MNQSAQVLSLLKYWPDRGITQKDVLGLGIFRLAARIKDLKDQGHPISATIEQGRNQHGNPVKFARYHLVKTP